MDIFKPEPYSDAVHIMGELRKSLQPISTIEMHLFAYLACVLNLWRGSPLSDWGYAFAVTSEGFPYSAEFELARAQLPIRGLALIDDNGRLTPELESIESEIDGFFTAERWVLRRELIHTAISCALAFPSGSIRYAIGQSPGLKIATTLNQKSNLFTESDIEQIYDEYGVVKEAIDDEDVDLLAPAIVWLSARILNSGEDSVNV